MYYFVGIKGSGMSSLAIMLKDMGYDVVGSDIPEYTFTMENLLKKEIKILEYNINNLNDDYYYIIQSENNSIEAKYIKDNYSYVYYHEFIGLIRGFMKIGVAGTHGKTTTTAILAHLLGDCNYIIGNSMGHGNTDSNIFIYEACEYKDHFLNYYPDIAIILNVEMDHIDYFKSYEQLKESFIKFSDNSKLVIYNGDSIKLDGISFGYNENNDYVIKDNKVYHNNRVYEIDYDIYSKNMMYDFVAALITYNKLGFNDFNEKIKDFKMPLRRFNEIEYKGHLFIDDYAHHPTELKNIIEMVKNKYKKNITIIFQPHQYERLVYFNDEFYNVLKNYDSYVLDLFNARSNENHNIDFFIREPLKRIDEFRFNDNIIIYASAGMSINELFSIIDKE